MIPGVLAPRGRDKGRFRTSDANGALERPSVQGVVATLPETKAVLHGSYKSGAEAALLVTGQWRSAARGSSCRGGSQQRAWKARVQSGWRRGSSSRLEPTGSTVPVLGVARGDLCRCG